MNQKSGILLSNITHPYKDVPPSDVVSTLAHFLHFQ